MKGKSIQDKYRILKTLGRNTFSETFLAKDKSWFPYRRYVIKKFRPILGDPEVQAIGQSFYREVSVLKRLGSHNNQIPRLYEYFVDGEDFYLVREWIAGSTLKQKVKQQGRLPEVEVEQILKSILSLLEYIHSYGIVYHQLKPSSIVLRQNNFWSQPSKDGLPVPIYFGGVKELEIKTELNQRSLVLADGNEYVSPEQERGQSIYASDLYSLGLTAIYLLTGKNPAEFPVDFRTAKPLWHREVPNLNVNLVRVINRAVCLKAQNRFASAEEMLQALHSRPITISESIVHQPTKNFFTPEIKIISALFLLGLGVLGITFASINLDLTQFSEDNSVEEESVIKSGVEEKPVVRSRTESANQKLDTTIKPKAVKIPVFPVGTLREEITNTLGEPTKESKGYWGNSKALLYRGLASNRVTLGYLSDADTQIIRQTEVTFNESVDLLTIQQTARRLLSNNYSPDIGQYIEEVHSNKSDRHEFKTDNLEGVIQRDPENRIYLGIWHRDFH